jgi:Ca-activated chloride channel homolog
MIWAFPDTQLILWLASIFTVLYLIYLYRFYSINKNIQVKKFGLFIKLMIRIVYFALIMISLLGPSIGSSLKEIKEEGKDIFIAVDLSQSMNVTDIGPNRLQRLKFELKNLVRQFAGDRIGLIIFSSEAFIQCPLTFDQNVLQLHIDGLHSGLVPNQGTDLGSAMFMALDKFNNENVNGPQSKTLILISDGEDFEENYRQYTSDLKDAGIKVFTLGVGTENGSTIPKGNGVLIDPKTKKPAISRLETSSLKAIANQTNGKYFELSENNFEIQDLIAAVAQQEGTVIGSRMVEASANKYFYFLLLGFLLALLDMLLPIKTIKL